MPSTAELTQDFVINASDAEAKPIRVAGKLAALKNLNYFRFHGLFFAQNFLHLEMLGCFSPNQ